MKKREKPEISDIVLIVISLVFFIGTLTFLHACGPKEDGTWMTCHWAGRALSGIGGAVLLLALFRLFLRSGAKAGLDLSVIVLSALMLFLPGHLIGLCMMPDMRCRSVMKPGATVFSLLLIAAAVWDLVIRIRKETNAEI